MTSKTASLDEAGILAILDAAASDFTFPVLDNGYIYLAATRLSLYRSSSDWALVIEVFGFSPRAGMPDVGIYTFGSTIHHTKTSSEFVTVEAYDRYLANSAHAEMSFIHPIAYADDAEHEEDILPGSEILLRGVVLQSPSVDELASTQIEPDNPPNVAVYEMCRWLAAEDRALVLCTEDERRQNVPAGLQQLMQLEEWNHPDIAGGVMPSASETFRQLAKVLATGETAAYRPSEPSNTHWRFWPDSGSL